MPEKITVRGIEFSWEVFVRDDGTVVQVSHPVYGSSERVTKLPIDPVSLASHMAAELIRCGPKTGTGSSPQEILSGDYDPYDTAPEGGKR